MTYAQQEVPVDTAGAQAFPVPPVPALSPTDRRWLAKVAFMLRSRHTEEDEVERVLSAAAHAVLAQGRPARDLHGAPGAFVQTVPAGQASTRSGRRLIVWGGFPLAALGIGCAVVAMDTEPLFAVPAVFLIAVALILAGVGQKRDSRLPAEFELRS